MFLMLLATQLVVAQSITSFTLINATNESDISAISNGQSFVLASLPSSQLNIRANTTGAIGSVVFKLNGKKNQTENVSPYALFGDINGNYRPWTPNIATYVVEATAFSQQQGKGSVLDSKTITLNFVEEVEPETSPLAPSNLQGSSTAPNVVDLTWNDNSDNETQFILEYKESMYTNSQWSVLALLPANTTQYAHTGLQDNEFNYYRVKAGNDVGVSDYSAEIEVTNFPSPPSNFLISDVTETSFNLEWTEAPYGNDYLIQTASSPSGPWDFFDALYFGYTEFVYSGLEPGTTYYLRMRTNFQGSSSNWSQVFSVTTLSDIVEPEGPKVTGFFMVNADTDQDIGPIAEGDTFNLFSIGTQNLNIRAEIDGGEESVIFGYNGNPNFSLENLPVYAIGGNTGSDYKAWIPELGSNSVTATAYTENKGQGMAGPSSTINFAVIDEDDSDPIDPGTGVDLGVSGELKKWHKVSVTFEGPELTERGGENPFKDYRLNVTFSNSSSTYVVPGYYAADGLAEDSGASSGKIWKVHFAPDAVGTWDYSVSFRKGTDVALSQDASAGSPTSFDGASGSFIIADSDKTGRDFRGQGRLSYVGEHYLQFEDSGNFFIKAGADAPENTFAYDDFDATPNRSNRRKSWQLHASDYSNSDAGAFTWGANLGDGNGSKGREMLGMLSYLSGEGMNVFSFLTFSLNGDDGNVYPHAQKTSGATDWSDVEHTRFDVSKMAQWEKIMEYADKKGIFLHFKTQETENDQRMDGGQLGVERKLYYRELIARFGHHLALNWNLGEENDIWQELNDPTGSLVKSYAQYIKDVDPYDHHVVIHTYPGQQDEVYDELIGSQSVLTGPSVQAGINNIHNNVRQWVQESRATGRKWVVSNDEQGGANIGVSVDASYPDNQLPSNRNESDNRQNVRHRVLWGTLMAGGAGVEYYYGYQTGCSDLDCQDHRTRQTKWDDARHALKFFDDHLQAYLTDMESNDGLTSSNSDFVFAKANEVYAIYLPNGGSTNINLGSNSNQYTIKWYNPRSGGNLQNGSKLGVAASTSANIGNPPSAVGEDWVALLTISANAGKSDEQALEISTRSFTEDVKIFPNPALEQITVSVDSGSSDEVFSLLIFDVNGRQIEEKKITSGATKVNIEELTPGNYFVMVRGDRVLYQQKLIVIK